jgi:hypothetical protein
MGMRTEWIPIHEAARISGIDLRQVLDLLIEGRILGRVDRQGMPEHPDEFAGVKVEVRSLKLFAKEYSSRGWRELWAEEFCPYLWLRSGDPRLEEGHAGKD